MQRNTTIIPNSQSQSVVFHSVYLRNVTAIFCNLTFTATGHLTCLKANLLDRSRYNYDGIRRGSSEITVFVTMAKCPPSPPSHHAGE